MSRPSSQAAEQATLDPCCSENGREVRDPEAGRILHLHDRHLDMQTGPEVGKSMCFRRLKMIGNPESREDDIWHMVQHMRGDRHLTTCWRPDQGSFIQGATALFDPVGHSIIQIALMDDYEPLNKEEAAEFEQLLRHAFRGDLQGVETLFDRVKQIRHPKLNPLQPVGAMAAAMGHFPVLQFAFDRGASLDRDLALAIRRGSSRNPEIKGFNDKNSEKIDDLIRPKPDPNYKPNVPYEISDRLDRELNW